MTSKARIIHQIQLIRGITLSLNRKPKSRIESALNPIDLTVLAEYHEQIESNLQRIERKNHRVWYSKPGEFGITCQGRQKVKGESIPLA
ncbi:hypothetical protein [Escherichia coli]|uniref:hypothetical protein n=1 Tax=Escherichia coli TaxID=562 RepID=UPI001FCE4641|nr:hypothetical protein [Escherichia coli]